MRHGRPPVCLVVAGLLPCVLWSCTSVHTTPRPVNEIRPVLGPADLEEAPKLAERVWVTRTDGFTTVLLSPSIWSDSIVGSPERSPTVPRMAFALQDVVRVQDSRER